MAHSTFVNVTKQQLYFSFQFHTMAEWHANQNYHDYLKNDKYSEENKLVETKLDN